MTLKTLHHAYSRIANCSQGSYLLNDFVATKSRDKLSGGSDSKVPLQVDASAFPALLHKVKSWHARPWEHTQYHHNLQCGLRNTEYKQMNTIVIYNKHLELTALLIVLDWICLFLLRKIIEQISKKKNCGINKFLGISVFFPSACHVWGSV